MFGCFTLIQYVLLHSNVIMDEFNMSRKLQDSNTLNISIKLKYAMLRNRIKLIPVLLFAHGLAYTHCS